MKRIKLVDARMNLEQLRVMGEIGQKYAQGWLILQQDKMFSFTILK